MSSVHTPVLPVVGPVQGSTVKKQGFIDSITPRKPLEYVALFVTSTVFFTLIGSATVLYATHPVPASQTRPAITRSVQTTPTSTPAHSTPVQSTSAYAARLTSAFTSQPTMPSKISSAVTTPAKRWHVAPASVRGSLGGKALDERILHGSGTHTYTLGQNDYLDFLLPTAPTAEQSVSFQGGYTINAKHRIDRASLSRLPLNDAGEHVLNLKGVVRLLDKSTQTPLSAYRIDLRFKTVTQPVVASTPLQPETPMYATARPLAVSTQSKLQVPAYGVTITDSNGTVHLDAKQQRIVAQGYSVTY